MKVKRMLAGVLAVLMVISGIPAAVMTNVFAVGGEADSAPIETIEEGVGVSVKYGSSIGSNNGVYELSQQAQKVFSDMTFENGEGILFNVLYKFNTIKSEMVPLFAVSGIEGEEEKSLTLQHNAGNSAGGQLGYIGPEMTTNGLFTTRNQPGINNAVITGNDWHKYSLIFCKTDSGYQMHLIYDGVQLQNWPVSDPCVQPPQDILTKGYSISKFYFGATPYTGTFTPGIFDGEVKYVEAKKLSSETIASDTARLAENTRNMADYAKNDLAAYLEGLDQEKLDKNAYTSESWSVFEAAKNKLTEYQTSLSGSGSVTDAEIYNAIDAAEAAKNALVEDEKLSQIRYAGGNEDGTLSIGEKTVSDEEKAFYDGVENLWVDVLYKFDGDEIPNKNVALFTVSDGNTETGKEQYVTLWHNPYWGCVSYSSSYLTGETVSNTAANIFWSSKQAVENGKWHKLTLGINSQDKMFYAALDGVKPPNIGDINVTSWWDQLNAFFTHTWKTGKVQIGERAVNGTYASLNQSGEVVNFDDESLSGMLEYVKVKGSADDVVSQNTLIDQEIEQEYNELLTECNGLVAGNYTTESWSAFEAVFNANREAEGSSWAKSDWSMLNAIEAITAAKDALEMAPEQEAYVAYAAGSDSTMGTLNLEIKTKEDSEDKQAVFTAEAQEYYKFDGWYQNQEGTEPVDAEKYTENPYTCDITDPDTSFTLYGKFVVDTDQIDELIAQAEAKQQEAGYESTYTDASRAALAAALTAAKAENGKTPENAKVLKAAIDGLIVKGEEPVTELLYTGGNEDGTLKPGEQELSEDDKAFYDGLGALWVDVLYKYNGSAVPDNNVALFTLSDGGTEEGNEQYITFWHDPAAGRVSYAAAAMANGTLSNTASNIFWSLNTFASSAGQWHKLTLGIDSQSKIFYAAEDGVEFRAGGIDVSSFWDQLNGFFAHTWETGKVRLGERAANGTYVTLNQGGDVVNFSDESVNGTLGYVKVKGSADDVITENQLIDAEIEKEYDAVVAQCGDLKAAEYTKASWDALQAALAANTASEAEGETSTWTKSDWAMKNGIDQISAAIANLSKYTEVKSAALNIGTEYTSRQAGDIFDGADPDSADGNYIQVKVNEGGDEINPADMEITWDVTEGSTGLTVKAISGYPSKATLSVEPGAKGTIRVTVTTRSAAGEEKTVTAECNVTVGYEIKAGYVDGSSEDMGSTQITCKDSAGKTLEAGSLLLPGDKAEITAQPEQFYLFKGWYKDAAGKDPYEDGAVDSYTYTVKDSDPEAENGVITFYGKFELDAENIVKIESITLTPEKETLTAVGETTQVAAEIKPDNASIKGLNWSSSDETIATVDQNGLVTAVASGEVTISAKAKDTSDVTATCKIKVDIAGGENPNPPEEKTLTGITVTPPDKTDYKAGEELDLTGMKVTASYSDGTTADVTADAVVSGYDLSKAGTQTITVTYDGKTATFTVTVKEGERAPQQVTNPPENTPAPPSGETGTGSGNNNQGPAVATGDSTPVGLMMTMMLFAAAIVVMTRRKKVM